MNRQQRLEKMKAYHEAGHAVVARVLGVTINHVTMFSTGPKNAAVAQTRSAFWLARNADLPSQQAAIAKDAKIAIAGTSAQAKFKPAKHNNSPGPPEWGNDIQRAIALAGIAVLLKNGMCLANMPAEIDPDAATRSEAELVLIGFIDETEVMVAKNWPAIERTAEALLSRRILLQDDVDALIADQGGT